MPKFHCMHCAQHIDAPDSMSGTQANCPTCGGVITVPGQYQPVLTSNNTNDSYNIDQKSNSMSGIATLIGFVVVCIFGGVVGKSCVSGNEPRQTTTRSSQSTSPNPPSTNSLTSYDVAGITLNLPSRPARETINLPPEAARMIRSFQAYKSNHTGAMVGVSHLVYTGSVPNLEGSADGAISEVRRIPGVTNFSSSKTNVKVSGHNGIRIQINARRGQQSVSQHGLVFVRGNELWQIQVIGKTLHNQELKELADSIFGSIRINN